jgi:hypothetical protein
MHLHGKTNVLSTIFLSKKYEHFSIQEIRNAPRMARFEKRRFIVGSFLLSRLLIQHSPIHLKRCRTLSLRHQRDEAAECNVFSCNVAL